MASIPAFHSHFTADLLREREITMPEPLGQNLIHSIEVPGQEIQQVECAECLSPGTRCQPIHEEFVPISEAFDETSTEDCAK